MTLEGRKWAFKKATACGPTTIILTFIIMYFTMAKGYDANPTTLVGAGVAVGGTVTVTSWICSFLQYLIVGGAFKKQFADGGQKIPEMGKREEQVVFWRWMPAKWWAYVLLEGVVAGVIFGTGLPCYIVSWVSSLKDIVFVNRLWYSVISGVFNGLGTWFAVYLSQIYLVQFFNEKAMAAQAAAK